MTHDYAFSKLIGLKAPNLEIINIEDGVVEFVYFGMVNKSEVEIIDNFAVLSLSDGDSVFINVNNIK